MSWQSEHAPRLHAALDTFSNQNKGLLVDSFLSFLHYADNTGVAQGPALCVLRRNHRGLRHYWGLRVKGQHTKTTGRRGKTVGVAKKR